MKALILAAVALVITGCSTMKPEDFANNTPRFLIEDYFEGQTRAWGIFQDRFGTVRRQFVVDIHGYQDGEEFVLEEDFTYADGETERRVWRITRTGEHTYEGRAGDVVGVARGEAHGNALNWSYDLNLKVGDSVWKVHFNDWMLLQPGGVMINRAEVTKWGIALGSVTLSFAKPPFPEAGSVPEPEAAAQAAE